MIIIGSALVGAILGGATARKQGGKTADMIQYAVGFGIAFSLLGVLVTIVILRMSV